MVVVLWFSKVYGYCTLSVAYNGILRVKPKNGYNMQKNDSKEHSHVLGVLAVLKLYTEYYKKFVNCSEPQLINQTNKLLLSVYLKELLKKRQKILLSNLKCSLYEAPLSEGSFMESGF